MRRTFSNLSEGVGRVFFVSSAEAADADGGPGGGWRSFFHRAQRREQFITQPVGSWAEVEGGGGAALLFDDDEWTPLPNAVKPHLTTPDSHLPFIRAPDVSVGTVTKKIIKNKLAPNEKEITKTVRVKAPFDKKKSE